MKLISIIGLPRSGTTLLGRTLAAAEGVAYFEEPNPLWRFRNWRRLGHEEFHREDATLDVCRYIRRSLVPSRCHNRYIVEKTPSNVLRIGFVEAVVPEARLLFVRRRGDDLRSSMLKKWRTGEDANATRLNDSGAFRTARSKLEKLRFVHPSEFPLYAAAEIRALYSGLQRGYVDFWGPQFKGWQTYRGRDPETVVEISCRRMEETLETGIAACRARHAVIAYEDLLADPAAVLYDALVALDCEDLDPSNGFCFFAEKV